MKLFLGIISLFFVGVAFASSPYCTVQFSAGEASEVPKESGFLPALGAQEHSGVKFTVLSRDVGSVAWGQSGTKPIFVPNCMFLATGSVIYVRATYVGQVGGEPLKAFCYNEKISPLSASEYVIPEFPGTMWKPC